MQGDLDRRGDGPALDVSALRRRPGLGPGPLATVVQDLLSIAVYLAIVLPLA